MKQQNYQNHIRYYTPHHFVFYPIVGFLFGLCIFEAIKCKEHRLLWVILAATNGIICWLSFMLRQHYSLGNQNRIARLEIRFRYYTITQKRFEDIEKQLSLSQILALRFASNEELVTLIERVLKENLSPDEIKKAIKNWVPDYMRL